MESCSGCPRRMQVCGVTERRIASFEELVAEAKRFRDDRDWAQFHSAKNLAAAIAIEAAELQEVLLWAIDESEVTAEQEQRIREELADVLIHCANLALALDIDIP